MEVVFENHTEDEEYATLFEINYRKAKNIIEQSNSLAERLFTSLKIIFNEREKGNETFIANYNKHIKKAICCKDGDYIFFTKEILAPDANWYDWFVIKHPKIVYSPRVSSDYTILRIREPKRKLSPEDLKKYEDAYAELEVYLRRPENASWLYGIFDISKRALDRARDIDYTLDGVKRNLESEKPIVDNIIEMLEEIMPTVTPDKYISEKVARMLNVEADKTKAIYYDDLILCEIPDKETVDGFGRGTYVVIGRTAQRPTILFHEKDLIHGIRYVQDGKNWIDKLYTLKKECIEGTDSLNHGQRRFGDMKPSQDN